MLEAIRSLWSSSQGSEIKENATRKTQAVLYLNAAYSAWADYWKSQTRKYCEFCKCWLADNKPSIQFHESGKKHQNNVANKLKEISRKSVKDQKARHRMDIEIKKMEQAAMKSYMKDAEQNLDFSSQHMKNVYQPAPSSFSIQPIDNASTKWHEAKSDRGDLYYWNSSTGETRWTKPPEGFHPLAGKPKNAPKPPKQKKPGGGGGGFGGGKRKGDKTNKNDNKKKKEEEEEPFVIPDPIITGPGYGRWERVVTSTYTANTSEAVEEIDDDDVPTTEFKEKTLPESGQSGESTTSCSFQFKKSKFRGNMRQRSDNLV